MYAGRVAGAGDAFVTVKCAGEHTVADLMRLALDSFGLDSSNAAADYRCSEILLDRGGMLGLRFKSFVHIGNYNFVQY